MQLDPEHALKWLRDGEIAPDPKVDPRQSPDNPELDRRAIALKSAFAGEQGRIALETILLISLFRAPVDHRLAGAEYRQYAQLREGQNQLAAGILAYLEHADTLERKIHDRRNPGPGGAEPGPGRPLIAGGLAVELARTREPPADDAGGSDDWLDAAGGGPLVALS